MYTHTTHAPHQVTMAHVMASYKKRPSLIATLRDNSEIGEISVDEFLNDPAAHKRLMKIKHVTKCVIDDLKVIALNSTPIELMENSIGSGLVNDEVVRKILSTQSFSSRKPAGG